MTSPRRPTAPLPLAVLLALVVSALTLFGPTLTGCKKFSGPETLEERIAKGKAAQAADATPGSAAAEEQAAAEKEQQQEEPKPPTFAEEAKAAMTAVASGSKACVADFVSKMDMGKIDDGFLPVNVNQMDQACREPITAYKSQGRKLIGKHPVLDAYLEHAAAFGDAYLRMSFKLKQLGARERWKVVAQIKEHREQIVEHAAQIAEGLEKVEAWADDTEAQTAVEEKKVSPETYRDRASELVSWLGERLPPMVDAYDKYGYRPADIQEAIYFFSFRYAYAATKRWHDVGVARFRALQCEDGKACEKTKAAVDELIEVAEKIFAGYEKGLQFYKGDYFKRLDKAVPIRDGMRDDLKSFQKLARKSRLG